MFIAVKDEILVFSIVTKLREEFHSLIEKDPLNANTQRNPDAILNKLHEDALSTDYIKDLALNKEKFPSEISHYCSNGRHNPLVTTNGREKCWQLPPKLKCKRKRKNKEERRKFIFLELYSLRAQENPTKLLPLC
ncbi:hypothetical protein O181_091366 [Austropuccinia psidii MF-1]|uniref:Uncharacterized protein n=1 Tax=Austropuccinia psidii MF-1 TaxID=1389203 RepID=A0A9Q3IXA9_9BASI|nr:hypothetical protein [Austropuccinia psidii MF-1]